ncbi:hypothetical protein QTP86_031313 [Hemibagrus guttatus]|nr:hypothetical protein QTP86_031313 [Hemibagrus guttatus]
MFLNLRHLKCKIVIVHRSDNKARLLFQTSNTPHEKTIYMFLHDNHYYGFKSITGLLGYSYVCCFWSLRTRIEMKKSDIGVINFLKEFEFPERLNPRDALYGGRTNALYLH